MGINDTKTLSHHPYILCHFAAILTQIWFVFVSCVQRRAVEGSGVGSGGCVVHFECAWRVSYVVGCWDVVGKVFVSIGFEKLSSLLYSY